MTATVRVALYVHSHYWEAEHRLKELRAYAHAQPGWQIVAAFRDDKAGKRRPGMKRALDSARLGQFDVLLVGPLEKVTRDARQLVSIIEQLDDANVALRSAAAPFDTSDPRSRIMLAILNIINEWELSKQLEAKRAQRAAAGRQYRRRKLSEGGDA